MNLISIFTALLGLIMGSFLNVVIIRYPPMLMKAWKKECLAFLNLPPETIVPAVNLIKPASHCPYCRHSLKWFQNIPFISYIILRGRCGYCRERISIQYPVIELLTAIVSWVVFIRFGWSWQTPAAWILSWILIVLAGIDWRVKILPDTLTLGGLWIGLIANIYLLFATPVAAIYGSVFGYLFFWIIATIFSRIRGKQGLGYGDFKLLALLGAWLGPLPLINVVLLAAFISLIVAIYLLIRKKMNADHPLPFGPSLALAGWLTLIFGPWGII